MLWVGCKEVLYSARGRVSEVVYVLWVGCKEVSYSERGRVSEVVYSAMGGV